MLSGKLRKGEDKMIRGIGGFILFLASYTILGSIIGVSVVYLLASRIFWSPPADGSLLDRLLDLSAAIVAGFTGVLITSYMLATVIKIYPARGIGIAFILWLVANYGLHFVFFPDQTDFGIYHGLVQSAVACMAAWFVFRLPPFSPPQSN
jgi:hypothetical protein